MWTTSVCTIATFSRTFSFSVHIDDLQGDLAESKCYSSTLRSYCVSALESSSAMQDWIMNIMKKTIQKRDIYYEFKGEEDIEKLDLIRSMLVLDPKKRTTIDNALKHVCLVIDYDVIALFCRYSKYFQLMIVNYSFLFV